jgi:hypothetical protein
MLRGGIADTAYGGFLVVGVIFAGNVVIYVSPDRERKRERLTMPQQKGRCRSVLGQKLVEF